MRQPCSPREPRPESYCQSTRALYGGPTFRLSDPAPLTTALQLRRNRGVRCSRFVRPHTSPISFGVTVESASKMVSQALALPEMLSLDMLDQPSDADKDPWAYPLADCSELEMWLACQAKRH